MKTFIIGATGTLGSNTAYALAQNGHEVTCIVRPSSHTESIPQHPNIKLVMNNLDDIEHELERSHYDWVINSACVYGQDSSLYGNMIDANLVFPLKVLNLAAKHKVSSFMTMGTSLPDNLNMYSFTKAQLAKFVRYVSENESRINFVELKLEMFYGKYSTGGGQNYLTGKFVQNVINKLKAGETLSLTAGTQKRDIIHIEDIISIIMLVMNMGIRGFRSLPVGTGEQHSIREIVEFLHQHTHSSSKLEFGAVESRRNEPDTLANIDWYDEIGYKLKYSFFGGLEHECMNS